MFINIYIIEIYTSYLIKQGDFEHTIYTGYVYQTNMVYTNQFVWFKWWLQHMQQFYIRNQQ